MLGYTTVASQSNQHNKANSIRLAMHITCILLHGHWRTIAHTHACIGFKWREWSYTPTAVHRIQCVVWICHLIPRCTLHEFSIGSASSRMKDIESMNPFIYSSNVLRSLLSMPMLMLSLILLPCSLSEEEEGRGAGFKYIFSLFDTAWRMTLFFWWSSKHIYVFILSYQQLSNIVNALAKWKMRLKMRRHCSTLGNGFSRQSLPQRTRNCYGRQMSWMRHSKPLNRI